MKLRALIRLSLIVAVVGFSFLSVSQLSRILGGAGDRLEFLGKAVCVSIILGSAVLFFSAVRGFRLAMPPFVQIVFLLAAAASLVWTYDVAESAKALASLTSFVALGFLVTNGALSARDTYLAVSAGCSLLVLLSLVGVFAGLPGLYDFKDGVWRLAGLAYGAHALARAAVIAAAIPLLLRVRALTGTVSVEALLIGVAFAVCVLASSRQTMFILLALVGILSIQRVPRKYLPGLALVGGLLALIVIFASIFGSLGDALVQAISRESIDDVFTLTNRTRIWDVLLPTIRSNPLLGFGYGAGGVFLLDNLYMGSEWRTTTAHNMLLQVLLEQGIFGLFAMAIYIAYLGRAFRLRGFYLEKYLVLVILSLGFVENSLASAPDYLFLLSVTVSVVVHRWMNEGVARNV